MKRCLLLVGCALAVAIPVSVFLVPSPPDADISARIELTVDGNVRHFRLVSPHSLSQSPPLVIAFHGTGDSTDTMAAYSELDWLAADSGFVLAYPGSMQSSWDTRIPTLDQENADLKFAATLIDELSKKHKIDRTRVYAIGMSNGATFAQLVAANQPNQVAATVAHSGISPTQIATQPILLIAGTDDQGHDSIQKNANAYSAAGADARFVSVAGLAHEWSTGHNGEIWQFLSRHTNASP